VPDLVDAPVGEDARRPGERMGAGTIALTRQVDFHQRLLHRVEGVLVVVEVAAGQPVQTPLVALDERFEGAGSTSLNVLHEGEVISLHTPLRVRSNGREPRGVYRFRRAAMNSSLTRRTSAGGSTKRTPTPARRWPPGPGARDRRTSPSTATGAGFSSRPSTRRDGRWITIG